PLDHGAGKRGVSMGPSALRIAHLHDVLSRAGHEFTDRGDLPVSIPDTLTEELTEANYLHQVAGVCADLAEKVQEILQEGGFPLVIGGDHSVTIGTISGIAAHLRNSATVPPHDVPPRLGLIWFDAHGDINTPETSPSGNIHGMPVACLLIRGPKDLTDIAYPGAKLTPERVVMLGLRDLDEQERLLLKETGVHTRTMADIDLKGVPRVVEEAIEIATRDSDWLHVSFDIDVLDPHVAPGTGTPHLGGLTYREAHLALELVAKSGHVRSLGLVEVNPILDNQNQTAELAVGLIASALGKTIL
ncbi:MAG: arginase, partial [Planctomycetota bacterium]